MLVRVAVFIIFFLIWTHIYIFPLNFRPVSKWIVSKVTKMQYSFSGATSFNGDLSHWDVQAVIDDVQMQTTTGMEGSKWKQRMLLFIVVIFLNLHFLFFPKMVPVFADASSFTGNYFFCSNLWSASPLRYRDLQSSGITDYSCPNNVLHSISLKYAVDEWFSCDVQHSDNDKCLDVVPTTKKKNIMAKYGHISEWNVSQVHSMDALFGTLPVNVEQFNADLSKWRTTKLHSMEKMFQNCEAFNSKLTNFDTSKVTSMANSFQGAHTFNQDLSHFDTSKVTSTYCMFESARKFNQGKCTSVTNGNVVQ